VLIAGLSADASHWRVKQEVRRADGNIAAILNIDGAWIQLDTRKLVSPGPELHRILQGLTRTRDFEEIRTVLKA
jgi:acyl-CoA thioester hydrolase